MATFIVTSLTAKAAVNPSNENKDERVARFEAYFSKPENQVIHPVGKLLSYPADAQGTIGARILLDGGSIPVVDLEVMGVTLVLAEGTVLSLDTLSSWGCLACGSAQGSGRYPSQKESAKWLAQNDFFFHPITRQLFTISPTCWDTYIKGGGHAKHFVTPKLKASPKPKA